MPWPIPKLEKPEKPKAPSRGRLASMGIVIFPLGSLIKNSDFNLWREKHRKKDHAGGDYVVFSDVEWHDLTGHHGPRYIVRW